MRTYSNTYCLDANADQANRSRESNTTHPVKLRPPSCRDKLAVLKICSDSRDTANSDQCAEEHRQTEHHSALMSANLKVQRTNCQRLYVPWCACTFALPSPLLSGNVDLSTCRHALTLVIYRQHDRAPSLLAPATVVRVYMNRLLLTGRSAFSHCQIFASPSGVGPCTLAGRTVATTVRRASMSSMYPTLDLKGQTVLITGE